MSPVDVRVAMFLGGVGLCVGNGDARIVVRDATGARLADDDDSGPATCPRITFTVPVGEVRYVQLLDFGDNGVILDYLATFDFP